MNEVESGSYLLLLTFAVLGIIGLIELLTSKGLGLGRCECRRYRRLLL
jgi:hypothetical protein